MTTIQMFQFSLSPYFSKPCENLDCIVLYIDEVILQRTGATDYYFTHDYRYSVTSLTNLSGNIIESYDYKVYGERTVSGSGLTDVGYTGQRHDTETGLMYFKNRYYSVLMGSFVTRDPLKINPDFPTAGDGYHDGMSLYLGYFGSNNTDSFGLADITFTGKWTNPELLDFSMGLNDARKRTVDIYEEVRRVRIRFQNRNQKCYGDLVGKLLKLEDILKKTFNLMHSRTTRPIEIYQAYIPDTNEGDYTIADTRESNWPFNGEEIRINTKPSPSNFFAGSRIERMRTVFHEFSHRAANTDDGESGNSWNNARRIDDLMTNGLLGWAPFDFELNKAIDCVCSEDEIKKKLDDYRNKRGDFSVEKQWEFINNGQK